MNVDQNHNGNLVMWWDKIININRIINFLFGESTVDREKKCHDWTKQTVNRSKQQIFAHCWCNFHCEFISTMVVFYFIFIRSIHRNVLFHFVLCLFFLLATINNKFYRIFLFDERFSPLFCHKRYLSCAGLLLLHFRLARSYSLLFTFGWCNFFFPYHISNIGWNVCTFFVYWILFYFSLGNFRPKWRVGFNEIKQCSLFIRNGCCRKLHFFRLEYLSNDTYERPLFCCCPGAETLHR